MASLLALALSAGVLSVAAVAQNAPQVRFYEGTTPEGATVRIEVLVTNGVPRLGLLVVSHAPYRCEDGTEGKTGTGVGWVDHGGPVIEDQHLELSDNWGSIAFTASGRIGLHRGSGTLTFLMAGLTADEQAQVCTMGEFAWTVGRITPPRWLPLGRDARVQRLDDGRMVMERARVFAPMTAARTSAQPVRHYRGRTSWDLGMSAQTRRVDTGIELLLVTFGFDLNCDDGSHIEGGYRGPFLEPPAVMPPGRFDVDKSKAGPGEALHVHGELDAHSGAGTLTLVWPDITDDLDAQLCTSGEMTWELWRTDAGY